MVSNFILISGKFHASLQWCYQEMKTCKNVLPKNTAVFIREQENKNEKLGWTQKGRNRVFLSHMKFVWLILHQPWKDQNTARNTQ